MNEEPLRVLVIDDDAIIRTSITQMLSREGYAVEPASSGEEALKRFEKNPFPVVIADLKMPGMDGIELLQRVRAISPEAAVVLMTGFGSIETAVQAMRLGAYDYVAKPISDGEIQHAIRKLRHERDLLRENRSLRKRLAESVPQKFHHIVGSNPQMRRIYSMIEAVAGTKATVFVRGESGTGKGMIARAIHECDPTRKEGPFIEVSCGALPETMLESELFGHVRGSFTGAIRDRAGRFELAEGGTIFLDEIDSLTPALQVKLLRVLQSGEFEKVGDTRTLKTNVRVIAAMNKDPEAAIRAGTFRDDLYYRLNVITIQVPPLRERIEDVPLLAEHFLSKFASMLGKPVAGMTPAAMEALMAHDWPGNVRELENAVERAVLFSGGKPIEPADLPESVVRVKPAPAEPAAPAVPPERMLSNGNGHSDPAASNGASEAMPVSLRDSLAAPERQMILDALNQSGWNCQRASVALGINRATLYNKMKKYGIPSKTRQKVARLLGKPKIPIPD